jgi:hypothetical protein
MPRFTLHRPVTPSTPAPAESELKSYSESDTDSAPLNLPRWIVEGLQTDPRVQILGELPRMLLIECPQLVAEEWLAKMPGWVLKPEQKATIPDPRPKLRKRGK